MGEGYLVTILDGEAYWERRRSFAGEMFAEWCKAAIEAGNGPCMTFNKYGFSWECPGCGHSMGGDFGDEAVSGWESPRWVKTGPADVPSLTPSLGCPRWREGTCAGGHYWLRDGRLVPA